MDHYACSALPDEVRVVLLGKTGAGKSSLGNTLLGRDDFTVTRGMCSGTDRCQNSEASRYGLQLQVTDTPGVCDTHRSEAEVLKEVGKSLAVAVPGPHAVLMVLRCDRRFTQEEYDAYLTLKRLFGDEICSHMVVVFVGVDSLGDSQKERDQNLRQTVKNAPSSLRRVLEDAEGRYCGVDNMASRDTRDQKAQEVLALIQNLITANQGRHFSSELLEEVDMHVQRVIEERMLEQGVPYDQALTSTRMDIVQEKVSPCFFDKLQDIVGNKILPVLKAAFKEAVALSRIVVATYCSVM